MLWYKAWLETRIRLWIALGYTATLLAALSLRTLAPSALPPPRSNPTAGLSMATISLITVICALLGGSGIASQASFQAMKGLHGSTQFTLSLPVSRLRLIAVRTTLGWLEMACAIGFCCGGLRLAAPALIPGAKAGDVWEYTATAIARASALYFVSVLLAIFMDDQWRMGGTMLAAASLWLILPNLTPLPAWADILRALGEGSPLAAHTMPWAAMAVSAALAFILFAAAVKAAQAREY